jgi:peptidoglycan/xylan/chitin deacetylase (PgdA/CDA1 family)
MSLASPAGSRGRLSILIFHRVLATSDPLFPEVPSALEFEARMRWVREWFNVLPLADAAKRLFDGTIPARALAITFDDGYSDNEEIAAPILKRLGLPATFFVSTGYLGGGCMWNDKVIEAIRACPATSLNLASLDLGVYPLGGTAERQKAIGEILTRIKHLEQSHRESVTDAIRTVACDRSPPPLMMSEDQVRSLRRHGMDIGGHTVTHPILTRLDADQALAEIRRGKDALEAILREPVRMFAYPNGVPNQDYTSEHTRMVRDCGFDVAVSTAWGAATIRSDRFQLPRFTPWDRSRLRFGARMLSNFHISGISAG